MAGLKIVEQRRNGQLVVALKIAIAVNSVVDDC